MGFHKADDDIGATLQPAVALLEHFVRLSNTRSRAEVDPQLSCRHGTSSRQRFHPLSLPGIFSPILICRWKSRSGSVGVSVIEVQVEGENIYGWLTEESEGPAASVGGHDRTKLRNGHAPGFRHTWYL